MLTREKIKIARMRKSMGARAKTARAPSGIRDMTTVCCAAGGAARGLAGEGPVLLCPRVHLI